MAEQQDGEEYVELSMAETPVEGGSSDPGTSGDPEASGEAIDEQEEEAPDAELHVVTAFERPFVEMGPILPPRPMWMLDDDIMRSQLGISKARAETMQKCPIFGGPEAPSVTLPFRVQIFSDEDNFKHLDLLRAKNLWGRLPKAEQELLDQEAERLTQDGLYWGVSGQRPGHTHADDLLKLMAPARSFLVTTVLRGEPKAKVMDIEQKTASEAPQEMRYGLQVLPSIVENHLKGLAPKAFSGIADAVRLKLGPLTGFKTIPIVQAEEQAASEGAEAEEQQASGAQEPAAAAEVDGGYVEADEGYEADLLAEGGEWGALADIAGSSGDL
eukprot:tig00000057_g123.t1